MNKPDDITQKRARAALRTETSVAIQRLSREDDDTPILDALRALDARVRVLEDAGVTT